MVRRPYPGRLPSLPRGAQSDVALAPLTTLHVGGSARWWYAARTVDQLRDGLDWARQAGAPCAMLGGGSNVIVPDAGFDGLVVQPALRGLVAQPNGRDMLLRVAAGEAWDAVAAYAVAHGWQGIECLSGIPGWAGAAPVQNIGAYGQEVANVVASVDAIERRTGRALTFDAADCEFGYRTSRFKRDPSFAIVAVTLRLRPGGLPTLAYPEVRKAAGNWASVYDVRREVLAIRRRKSMLVAPLCTVDDDNQRSAGSFFVNPVLDMVEAVRVRARAMRIVGRDVHEMPWHRLDDGRVKLSAAWLIERAGVARGYRRGNVGVSSAHCLALINHGRASAGELFDLETAIRRQVANTFGVTLEREPVILGTEGANARRSLAA